MALFFMEQMKSLDNGLQQKNIWEVHHPSPC
jgi:hypothetical protein